MKQEHRGALIGGLILIFVGLAAFAGQVLDFGGGVWGSFLVLGLGLAFLIAGVFTHQFGYFVPGGVLTGIGAGIALIAGPWENAFGLDNGGLFLLAFAGGWFLITLMGLIFNRQFHWWPLIPGSIIGLVGLSVAYGGVWWTTLTRLGTLWPLILIAIGAVVLVQSLIGRDRYDDELPVEKKS